MVLICMGRVIYHGVGCNILIGGLQPQVHNVKLNVSTCIIILLGKSTLMICSKADAALFMFAVNKV